MNEAYRHKASQERQLQSALALESQARQALARHQSHLAELQAQRADLIRWLAQLELDNQSLAHPVRIRWLLDGGFGDAANVTYLIELGYEIYSIAHNGKTTQGLLNQLEPEAAWTQVGSRTQAIELNPAQAFGACPYPLRLTLLRWQADETSKQTTLVSFSEGEPLPITALFPTYHQRQDVEIVFTQMTKTDISTGFSRWNNVTDFYLTIINNDPVNQQFHQLSLLSKGGLGQSLLNPLAESFNGGGNGTQLKLFKQLCF